MSIVSAIYTEIIGDSVFTNQLGSYDFGAGDAPAVFTAEPAPEDSDSPMVVITQIGGSLGTARDRTHRGGEVTIDVKLWGDKGDSEKVLRELADDLWLLLDRADLTITGMEFCYCLAEPPRRLSDPQGFPGFLVSCRVLVRVT